IEDSKTMVRKILCLHGGGGDAKKFQFDSGITDLKNALGNGYEFVFAQAKDGGLWMRDPPGGKSRPTTDPDWASKSINILNEIVAAQGPFYGILGYSQGAAFIPVYLAQISEGTFQIAVMFGGYLPTTHQGLSSKIKTESPFKNIPALVWIGGQDWIAKGKLTVIGYRLFKYGHLAIVVEDPNAPGRKVLFTSESAKGVNVDEDADSLQTHNWDAYRLDKWDRIDLSRIREGILRCKEKSGNFFGYDFTGMFALWNEDLKPDHAEDFGTEYICSTSVVTLLYFGGFESDATPRQELDLITPYQVVRAKGRFVKPPDLPGEE
ncbi:serine hydrolase family protein, partial [Akkermansiaceae bacterium]|nr:serine hydrolase family protein [Akkermansiaceae bacterium]